MKVNVLLFGKLAEISNSKNVIVENHHHIDSLISHLNSLYPGLKDMKYKIALNQNIITGDNPLKDGDEVALLPPYSGG